MMPKFVELWVYLSATPLFGLNYDPSHPVLQRMDEIKPLYQYRERLHHIHLKDIRIYQDKLDRVGMFATFTNLFGNVVIFIPFGFFMPMASRYRSFFLTLFYSFGVSFFVECFQLVTRVGSFDVDDMLLNTLGGVIGYIVFAICNMIRRWHDAKQER